MNSNSGNLIVAVTVINPMPASIMRTRRRVMRVDGVSECALFFWRAPRPPPTNGAINSLQASREIERVGRCVRGVY